MICCLLLSAGLTSIAQRNEKNLKRTETFPVTDGERHAYTEGRGVWLSWETGDIGAKAFNIYRISKSGRELANPQIIVRQPANQTYFDNDGELGSVYEIESISSEGVRSLSVSFAVEYVSKLEDVAGRTADELSALSSVNGNLESTSLNLPQELRNEVKKSSSISNLQNQRAVAAQVGVKIGIRKDGLYRVLRSELQGAGFDVNTDQTKWQLSVSGVEQAIIVENTGAFIEFYANAVEAIESDFRYYYLVNGNAAGRRMPTRVSRPSSGTVVGNNYQQTFFMKQRKSYIYDILNGDAENYWGDLIASSSTTFPINLSGIDTTAAKCVMNVTVQGFVGINHLVSFKVNGNVVGSFSGTGEQNFGQEFLVPTNLLLEGANTLTLATSSSDFVLFDSVKINYTRKFLADQNKINFYTNGYRKAVVTGFASPNIRMFDLTTEGEPIQVTNLNIVQNGATWNVNLPAYRPRVMFGIEDSAIRRDASIIPNTASSLATPTHSAQLVIVSYGDFMAAAETWANYRRSQGISVEVIDIADVYDEFNYGIPSSRSITDFLFYAKNNWQVPPGYVLLLGDASYDPRNYQNFGYLNLIPSKMVNTVYLETSSDEALADFNGDGLSEIAIGRIPARTSLQVTNALAKVMRFETPTMQNLNRGAVFACDVPNGYDFCGMNQALMSQMPNIPSILVRRGLAPPANEFELDPMGQNNFINAVNSTTGKYVVNYAGHGTISSWVNQNFFGTFNFIGADGFPQVNNVNKESIFTMLTCLNGYFIQPNATGLAEVALHHQNGGAVASWASTGKTTPDVQLVLALRFYSQLSAGNITRIGDLIRDAKTQVPGGRDVLLSWALMGDPMLKVR